MQQPKHRRTRHLKILMLHLKRDNNLKYQQSNRKPLLRRHLQSMLQQMKPLQNRPQQKLHKLRKYQQRHLLHRKMQVSKDLKINQLLKKHLIKRKVKLRRVPLLKRTQHHRSNNHQLKNSHNLKIKVRILKL